MPPRRTRAKRLRDIASPLRPSVEAAPDRAPPISHSTSNHLIDNGESSSNGHEPDKRKNRQEQVVRVPWSPQPKPYDPETYGAWGRKHLGEAWYQDRNARLRADKVLVNLFGQDMLLPRTYDPDTYDPDRRMPWTPEPESDDSEAYAAWGRKHFGDDWYEQRQTMIRERNFYMPSDPVYKERQIALRVLEHKVEGRPFRPGGLVGEMSDEGWKRLWARLSQNLAPVEATGGNSPASPMPRNDSGSDTDLSGFNTYAPTPETREPTPLPDGPWAQLEYDRKRLNWDEEAYQYNRIFLKEGILDAARTWRENKEGDRRRKKELEEIEKVRYEPGTLILSAEYEYRMRNFDRRAEGMTQEQMDAEDRAIEAEDRRVSEYLDRLPARPKPVIQVTREEMEAKHRDWDASGTSKERQAQLVEMFGYSVIEPSNVDEAAESEVVSPPQASPPRQTKSVSRKTRAGRIKKNTAESIVGRGARSRRSRRSALAPEKAPTPDSISRPNRSKQAPDVVEEPGDNATTPTPLQPRRSRRLAGQLPKYSKLSDRGEALPYETTTPSRQQSLSIRKTSSNSGSPRSNGPSNKPTAAKGAKPQGISRSTRQGGTGRSKKRGR